MAVGGAAADGHAAELDRKRRMAGGIGDEHRYVADMMARSGGIAVRFSRWIEVAARANPVSRAAIAFFMDVKAMAPGGQSGNFRLDDNFVALLRKRNRAGRRVALGRFQPCDRRLRVCRRRGADRKHTNRSGEYEMRHGTSWRR